MVSRAEKVAAFRKLHQAGCFIMPNVWEAGGARMMEALGFPAIATTSSGFAYTIGRADSEGELTREDMLAHARLLAGATDLPVNGDFEDCYAETPEGVAETVRLAAEAGLAGVSIEDLWTGGPEKARTFGDAVARVEAAADAAKAHDIVLTARADGIINECYGLGEAIRRLKAFEDVGAEVLYAPGVPTLEGLKELCNAVSRPVNHLVGVGIKGANLAEIEATGARRISLGGTLAKAAQHALRSLAVKVTEGDFSEMDLAGSWDELFEPN